MGGNINTNTQQSNGKAGGCQTKKQEGVANIMARRKWWTTQDKWVTEKRTTQGNWAGNDTTRRGGRKTQCHEIWRRMIWWEGETDNVGGWQLLVVAADNGAWYQQGEEQTKSRATWGCIAGVWMQLLAVGEDAKVGGGRRGDRYFTLIFHGHVWLQGQCVIYTWELLWSIIILKNTQDQSLLTEDKTFMYVGYLCSDYDWLQFWLACK